MSSETEEIMEKQETAPRAPKKDSGAKKSIVIGVVVLILILAGLYAHQAGYLSGKKDEALKDDASVSAEDVVATVNGQQIPKAVLDARFTVARQTDTTTDETTLKQQVLAGIIDEIIVLQSAEQAGIAPTSEQVQEQFDIIKARFESEEAFNQELTNQNVTIQDVYADIQRQLTIQSFLVSRIDEAILAPTEQEIQTFYDQSVAGQEDAPAFEEVQEQIKTQIQTQKSQQAVQQLLAQLRSQSSIQTTL